jgi:hypothetical protein
MPRRATTLDSYSQAIDASKLAAQRDIATAITGGQLPCQFRDAKRTTMQ